MKKSKNKHDKEYFSLFYLYETKYSIQAHYLLQTSLAITSYVSYSNCSKISSNSLGPFSQYNLYITSLIHKILVTTANCEEPDQTAPVV